MNEEIGRIVRVVRLRMVLFRGIYLSAKEVAAGRWIVLGMFGKFHCGLVSDRLAYRQLMVLPSRRHLYQLLRVAHSALCRAPVQMNGAMTAPNTLRGAAGVIYISINPSKPALNGPFRYNLKKTFVIAMKYMTRRTIDSWIHFALEAAWPVSATMAMVILALGFVIFPTVAHESRLLTVMSQGLKPVALIAASLLGLISLAKWIVAFSRAAQISTIKRDENNPKNSAVDRSDAAHKFPEFRREPSIYSVKRSPPIKEWSLDLIQSIDWKRFENVCQKFYEAKEIHSACVPLGSDGGIDMRLFQGKAGQATAIVQCKACGDSTVGVKPIRELLGVMVHEKVDTALFMTSGKFSDDAKAFASPNRITLIDGRIFFAMIKRLPGETRHELLEFATDGDYNIPTCPACGTKMWLVTGKEGQRDFWGCPSFPKCRQKFWARRGTSNPPTAVYQ